MRICYAAPSCTQNVFASSVGMARHKVTPLRPGQHDGALDGGYGYLMDYPIERFWRDLRVHSILEGINQIMRMIIGRELTRS